MLEVVPVEISEITHHRMLKLARKIDKEHDEFVRKKPNGMLEAYFRAQDYAFLHAIMTKQELESIEAALIYTLNHHAKILEDKHESRSES